MMPSTTAASAAATRKLETPIRLCTCALSISTLLPPICCATTVSPSMGMKVKTKPATTPGSASGKMMCTSVLNRRAPRSLLASRKSLSIKLMERKIGHTMVGKKAPRKPKCTANSEKISQVTGSSTAPVASSAWLTTPLMPRTERQTMTRAAGLRKNGTVSAVKVSNRTMSFLQPFASHKAKGNAIRSSMTVIVPAIRTERTSRLPPP